MATITIENSTLTVKLTMLEALAAMRGGYSVPLSKVTGAEVVDRKFWASLGFRVPGTALPPFIIAGTYLKKGDRAFVHWSRKLTPLQINLHDAGYDRLVIGMENAEEWAQKISAAAKI